MKEYDVIIIGGGIAGLGAAVKAKEYGIDKILIIERESRLGGILNQCINSGFGKKTFKKNLTGPEYIEMFITKVKEMNIEYKLNTTVIELNKNKVVKAINEEDGLFEIKAKSLIIATGCKEKYRGTINVPGSKSAGIFTAGTVQKFINLEGYMPGKEIVVLGSGNIALIVAKRLILEGGKVRCVIEFQDKVQGFEENNIECLEDFNIPIKLCYTVVNIKGKDRVEGVTIAKVDKHKKIIKGTEEFICCDTVVLSAELFPDNELAIEGGIKVYSPTKGIKVKDNMETSESGIFACGDVTYIHDYVDIITNEAYIAGKSVAEYVNNPSLCI